VKKKYVWIIIAVVILAIVGIVFATSQKSDEERLIEYMEGTDKYTGISHEYVVSPNVSPEAKKMIEIKYEIDQGQLDVEILAVGLTLHNTSNDQIIEEVWVSMRVLDDKNTVLSESKKLLSYEAIGPGETNNSPYLFKAYLEHLESPSKFVITLEKVDIAGASITAGSPGQMVVAFFEAIRDGRYAEAESCLFSKAESLDYFRSWRKKNYSSLEEAWRDIPPEETVVKIEVSPAEFITEREARIKAVLYFPTGETFNPGFTLFKENGEWKLKFP